ncbi:MAG: hypothetical protein GXO35_07855, partial [Gammaproteobacteria bacterium]|nr:hypothetical protein [Gammaproteobacteria bacterium]
MKTRCSVPAKLILSGEHAVLYHCPALSMAIDLTTYCDCTYSPSATDSFTIELTDFHEKHNIPAALWLSMASEAEVRFELFKQNTGPIQAVLSKPIDLILVTLYHFNLLFPIKQGA